MVILLIDQSGENFSTMLIRKEIEEQEEGCKTAVGSAIRKKEEMCGRMDIRQARQLLYLNPPRKKSYERNPRVDDVMSSRKHFETDGKGVLSPL